MNPGNLKYTETHEWVRLDEDLATVGITEYAESELGEKVFVEMPKVGTPVRKGDVFGAIESYKAVSDLVAPLSGEVAKINEEVARDPEIISQSPYDRGWIAIIRVANPRELDSLMSADDYETFLKEH